MKMGKNKSLKLLKKIKKYKKMILVIFKIEVLWMRKLEML